MNLGIIGYGYTGQQHARALKSIPGLTLRAVAESAPERRANAQAQAYEDYRRLLDDPAIGAVSICLPHFLHERVATDALLAKKHVLVEKPLAMSTEGGERLCKLARRESRILMVEMTHRFMPPIVQARNLVKAGEVGEVLAVVETLVEGMGLFGSLPTWMFSKATAGGGVGLTSGIHLLDHIAWITGEALRLDSACFRSSQGLGDIDDVAAFSLHLASGAPVQIMLSWRANDGALLGDLTVYGSRGTLSAQIWRGWILTNASGTREQESFEKSMTIPERACVGMNHALEEFTAAVSEGRDPCPQPDETLVSQRLIEQAYASARSADDRERGR
jgi:predicted dehydrogenase